MKIWVQFDGDDGRPMDAFCGGLARGVSLDGRMFPATELVANVAIGLEAQGFVPLIRVAGAIGMKRQFGGLAIVYKDLNLKTKMDAKTLMIPPDGTKHELDHAIEKVLEFYKRMKLKRSV